ncbi:MAG: hypothetical protein R3B47_14830 [Bacteroidia bacterium]
MALLTGNIGRPGVGVNPLRGQNNVQGSADMGVQPRARGAGYLDVTKDDINERYATFYGVDVPKHIGYKIPEMFDAALNGKLTKSDLDRGEDVDKPIPIPKKSSVHYKPPIW